MTGRPPPATRAAAYDRERMALFPRWTATDEAAPPRPFHDRFEAGRVLVEDAKGQPPTIPFWTGEAPARTVAPATLAVLP